MLIDEAPVSYDPLEDTPEYQAISELVEQDVEALLRQQGKPDYQAFEGWCHFYWECKKQVLREKYGLEWQSPQDLSPHVPFV